jgi:hypothetical protein
MMRTIKLNALKKWPFLTLTAILIGTTSCHQGPEKPTEETKDETKEEIEIVAPSSTIQEAAFFGNTKAISEHIAAKTDLNQKDEYGSTPLHISATFGKTEVALLLIAGGANLNEKSADGSTPLHTAAFFGRKDIVKALLDNNADVSLRNIYNSTAIESVSVPFDDVKAVYDQMSKDLGPFGFKIDYDELKANRPLIAEMIKNSK